MNKKLLASAIAAAMVAPAAYAQATMYGKFHASIDAIDYETSGEDNYEVNSRASRVGIKGSEDLGGGLKAIYQLELGVDINSSGADGQDSSGSVFGSRTRNTFIGLAGGFGTFLVGRHDTPAKVAFYAAGNDRLGDSVIDLNLGSNLTGAPSTNAPIGVFHEYRADDAIVYVSPNFSGFTVAAAIIPGEDNGKASASSPASFNTVTVFSAPTTAAATSKLFTLSPGSSGCKNQRDGIADHWSLGLMYAGGGLKASAGYASYDLDPCDSDARDDYEVLQVGGSYTFGAFSVGGQYETSENVGGAKDADYDAWAITGKATFGNNAVSLVYTDSELDPSGPSNNVDRGGWGISGEHNFSKRSKVYAAYASGETEYDEPGIKDEDDDVFSLGMIHNF